MGGPVPILSLTLRELTDRLAALGQSAYRASQIFEWIWRKGAADFSRMTNLSAPLRADLARAFSFTPASVDRLTSRDGTRKFRMRFPDGKAVECVWMPDARRATLCVSSQAGCDLGCTFCVTGAAGPARDLTADEIVEQFRHVRFSEELPVSNVVFMGMGEPLLNPEAVARAIEVLCEPKGPAVGKRRITVSTVGITPRIQPFFARTGVRVAVSWTGATEDSRTRWMPVNRKYPLKELLREIRSIRFPKGRHVFFEIVLLGGENDTEEEAGRVAQLLHGIPARVNLIPYNENPVFPALRRPGMEKVLAFQRVLMSRSIRTLIRKNRGQDIMAACGQLAGGRLASIREAEEKTT